MHCAASPDYHGIIRLSESGAHIFNLLAEETTEAAILDALTARYDAPRETLEQDLKEIIDQCREAGLLEE